MSSTRHKLQAAYNLQKANRLCWRCALTLSRSSFGISQLRQYHSRIAQNAKELRPVSAHRTLKKHKEHDLSTPISPSCDTGALTSVRPEVEAGQESSANFGKSKLVLGQAHSIGQASRQSSPSQGQFRGYLKRRPRSKPRVEPVKLTSRLRSPLKTASQSRPYATAASELSRHYESPGQIPKGETAKLESPFEGGNIRDHLRLWQEQQDRNPVSQGLAPSIKTTVPKAGENFFTQSGEDDTFNVVTRETELEVEDDDHVDFSSEEPTSDALRNGLFLRKGDLVELSAGTEPILAIFVRNVGTQCQFYTMRGEWLHRESTAARFFVPLFVKPNELDELMPYLPSEAVAEEMMDRLQPLKLSAPRGAGANLLEKLSLFHQAADNVFRKNADRLNRAYEIVAPSERDSGPRSMTLRQIAVKVLQKKDTGDLTAAMTWAVHRAIVQCQNITYDMVNFRQNMSYTVYPQHVLTEIAKVRDWVRNFQEGIISESTEGFDVDLVARKVMKSANPIATFVKKSRMAVERSRQNRSLSPNGFLGPSSVKVEAIEPILQTYKTTCLEKFSDEERIIIQYLDAWVASRYLNRLTNFSAVGPMILRAVDMYDGFELDESMGFTFLQELGVITPWENRAPYSLKSVWRSGDPLISGLEDLKRGTLPKMPSGPATDSMKGLRKDWCRLPVFCIDGAGTLERDDGISVESVDGSQSEYWVHIHVANPSAFINPQSAEADYAANLGEALYFPERRYPMLSPNFTNEFLSLADGRPCITFSARMTTEGDILERNITPGILRDVHYLTPFTVSRELGIDDGVTSDPVSILRVGGETSDAPDRQPNETTKPLTQAHVDMLRKLMELASAAHSKRTARGAPEFYSSAQITSTNPQVMLKKPVPEPFTIRDGEVRLFEGDPIINITRRTDGFGRASKLVSDMMVLAGDIAAKWCMERNLPIPYRGIMRNPEPASSPEIFKKEVLEPDIAKYGHANQWDLMRYMRLLGQPATSVSPLEHHALGLPAYCKATSPLRRYVDMYTHWQIEAALRYEARTGKSLVDSTDDSYLPFDRNAVRDYTSTALQHERKLRNASSASNRHWMVQALFRAYYFKEAPLPDTFEVTALMRYKNVPQGWLNGWDTRVIMTVLSQAAHEADGVQSGDLWETKICEIDPYHKTINMEPIRLIRRGAKIESVGRL